MKEQESIEVEMQAAVTIEGLGDDFDSGADSFVDCAAVMANRPRRHFGYCDCASCGRWEGQFLLP